MACCNLSMLAYALVSSRTVDGHDFRTQLRNATPLSRGMRSSLTTTEISSPSLSRIWSAASGLFAVLTFAYRPTDAWKYFNESGSSSTNKIVPDFFLSNASACDMRTGYLIATTHPSDRSGGGDRYIVERYEFNRSGLIDFDLFLNNFKRFNHHH